MKHTQTPFISANVKMCLICRARRKIYFKQLKTSTEKFMNSTFISSALEAPNFKDYLNGILRSRWLHLWVKHEMPCYINDLCRKEKGKELVPIAVSNKHHTMLGKEKFVVLKWQCKILKKLSTG